MTVCWACKIDKPDTAYSPSLLKHCKCRECNKKSLRIRQLTPGTDAANSKRFMNWRGTLRRRCIKAGIKFELDISDFRNIWTEQCGKCALTGVPFRPWGDGRLGAMWDSPTVDRIHPTRGYTQNNVRMILYCINSFRGNMNDKEMGAVAYMVFNTDTWRRHFAL